ncbi:MAG: hypothetical protein MJ120_04070 [Clostridia bacterium]|nr:hypothetical protein [Clostridia bacterium]
MKKKRLQNSISIILNVAIVLFTVYAISVFFTSDKYDALFTSKATWMRYFTNLSNIFVAIASLVTLIFNCKMAYKDKFFLPKWVMVLKFSATVSVTLTLMTVVCFLAPVTTTMGMSYFQLFKDNNFFLHFFTPVLAIISVIFFERTKDFKFKYCLFGILPTVLYSIAYIYEVVFVGKDNGGWPDFYHFTFGGNFKLVPIVGLAMYAVTFAFCAIIWKFNSIRTKKVLERKGK